MHVTWKRPDGFIDATPADYKVVTISGKYCVWLHKNNRESYPFRIAGGWQKTEATHKLNQFVNLLGDDESAMVQHLTNLYHHSMKEDPATFIQQTEKWLEEISGKAKGDTWEVEIITQTIAAVIDRIRACQQRFLDQVSR